MAREKKDKAPVVLFVYNRPEHTRKVLESLSNARGSDETDLIVYSDGPKEQDSEKVLQVRNVLGSESWCRSIQVIERPANMGSADSIVEGVTEVVNQRGEVIVIEDDNLVSTGFLEYMNNALELYRDERSVMHISGYMFPVKQELPPNFFFNSASCWGWATWARAWALYNPDPSELFNQILEKNYMEKFRIHPNTGFDVRLRRNVEGTAYNWDIKWHASVVVNQGHCLHPYPSLVHNIGHDGTGVNSATTSIFDWKELASTIPVKKIEIDENRLARQLMLDYYQGLWKQRPLQRISNGIRNRIRGLRNKGLYSRTARKYKDYSMIPTDIYIENLKLVVGKVNLPGSVVECGVWKGGMIAGMAEVLGPNRDYYLCDSFEGLPAAREIDGLAAIEWQSKVDADDFFDNCRSAQEDAEEAMQRAGVPNYRLVKGWFEKSLPDLAAELNEILVLRLDGDWYDSTLCCLQHLFPKVKSGGIVIVDDYYTWDGCARAVHDYLSQQQSTVRIMSSPGGVCYLEKD